MVTSAPPTAAGRRRIAWAWIRRLSNHASAGRLVGRHISLGMGVALAHPAEHRHDQVVGLIVGSIGPTAAGTHNGTP